MSKITHEQLDDALAGVVNDPRIERMTGYGKVRLEITLGPNDVVEEKFTSTHGRLYGGPGRMEIDLWDDGGINVGTTGLTR